MRRRALLVVLVLLGACSDRSAEPAPPGGAAATTTSSPPAPGVSVTVGGAGPGSVVLSAPVTFGEGDGAVEGFRLRYRSIGADGQPTEVTGVVLVPPGEPPEGGWPVLAWAHGTTGSADACAPSAAPGGDDFGSGRLGDLARRGFVVAATDYEGLGGPGRHPYLHGGSEARSVIDSVRAARALVPATSPRWVAVGHSQGGHAVLFAAEEAVQHAPELELVGAVAFAPAAGLPFFPALRETPGGAFLLLVLNGYLDATGADPATVLSDVGAAAVEVAETECIGGLVRLYGRAGTGDPLLPGAADEGSPFATYLRANETGQRATTVPLLVLQGGADQVVPAALTEATVARLCALGDVVELRRYEDADHGTVLAAGADDAAAWIDARFAGPPPTATC